ncbi:hypothetical protein AG0111_0g12056 [Alternaria gaisen]|uniref:Uncharacterized protein n=1 Tax=Alternaria gaisen TaxID=167740 RepID=A0ACB6F598_9PLEO|nr:hypothetical protein AG0111_0g12056 [Alternaria gaisen]
MAGTKRSRADSDTEEEKSNAKRHNGAAPEHEAEEETPKDRPSQDQSKKAIMAEQHDAEQKVEEKSSDSKKRTRETESTDAPEAKRKASESATKPSGTQAANHGKSSYDHGHRTKLRTTVRACKSLADCGAILNKIPRSNLITLAFALNDAKEDHRRQLLRMLPRTTISQIVDILANAYMDRSRYDPKSLFPNVALSKVLQTLPHDERMCNICKREFDEFEDMIPKGCGKHSFHKGCLAKQLDGDELPFFAVCECF